MFYYSGMLITVAKLSLEITNKTKIVRYSVSTVTALKWMATLQSCTEPNFPNDKSSVFF